MERRGNSCITGRKGEELACRFLSDRGHTVIERNWRWGHLEIDIITIDRNGIHFVEVKSRGMSAQAEPQESVGRIKQKRIAYAAKRYLSSTDIKITGEVECHFDVIAVTFGSNESRISLFEDAFIPGL